MKAFMTAAEKARRAKMNAAFEKLREEINKRRSGKKIAEFLASKGVKGLKKTPMHCPLARFYKRSFRGKVKGGVFVSAGSFILAWAKDYECTKLLQTLSTPKEKLFMSQFDNGKYPELESKR